MTVLDVVQLTAVYSTWAAVHRDAMSLGQGMFLRTEIALAQFARVQVHIALPDGEQHELAGEVVSVVPGQALALQWRPETRDEIEKLLGAAAANAADPAQPASAQEPVVAALVDDDEPDGAPVMPVGDRESLAAQIEAMSIQEKRQSALHGRKDMRWLLVRDHNKSVHPFVVKNPAITLDEIEQIARLTTVNPEVLHTIAHNRDWTKAASVMRNLVKNPKTPMPDALLLLDKLPIGDVRALAKSPSVRMPIQMAARKRVNG